MLADACGAIEIEVPRDRAGYLRAADRQETPAAADRFR